MLLFPTQIMFCRHGLIIVIYLTVKDDSMVGRNLISNDSYFAKGIELNGTQLELNESSKVISL